jgi:2-C-methyl-D-erythritol 4-phosphate cytidylyltransferase
VPPKDTVKRVDNSGWVEETPARDQLRLVQTPQLFERKLLEKVHIRALEQGYYATDDASLLEWQGYKVKVLEGSYENIKVTTRKICCWLKPF